MAATVLNSPEAVAMSVFVVRAFMQMREQLAANAAILKRLAEIDKTLLEHDSALRTIWAKLQPLLLPPADPPKRRIGFKEDVPTRSPFTLLTSPLSAPLRHRRAEPVSHLLQTSG